MVDAISTQREEMIAIVVTTPEIEPKNPTEAANRLRETKDTVMRETKDVTTTAAGTRINFGTARVESLERELQIAKDRRRIQNLPSRQRTDRK